MKLALAIVMLALSGTPAAAQSTFDAFAGVSAGAGYSTADDGIPIVSIRGGALLSPRFAVFGEGWTNICRESRALGLGARYWPWRKVWIAGAGGVARRAVGETGTGCFPDAFKRFTGAWTGARLGADLTRDKYFALELAVRATYELYFDGYEAFEEEETEGVSVSSVALEFGISFY